MEKVERKVNNRQAVQGLIKNLVGEMMDMVAVKVKDHCKRERGWSGRGNGMPWSRSWLRRWTS